MSFGHIFSFVLWLFVLFTEPILYFFFVCFVLACLGNCIGDVTVFGKLCRTKVAAGAALTDCFPSLAPLDEVQEELLYYPWRRRRHRR